MNKKNNDLYPLIDKLVVDVGSLLSLEHNCDPGLCSSSKSCCSCFQVFITKKELERLVGFMPEASAYTKNLQTGGSYNNVFDEEDNGLFSVETDDSGLCVFGYRSGEAGTFCSLHSAALKMDLKPEEVKPFDCMLWPLALTEEKPLTLTIDNDAFDFPCNKKRASGASSLDPGVEDIILRLYGDKFLKEINDRIVS